MKLDNAIKSALATFMLLQGALSYADDTDMFLSQQMMDAKPNLFWGCSRLGFKFHTKYAKF